MNVKVKAQDVSDETEFDPRTHYNKHEILISMRDGVQLFTAIYTPKDQSVDYPILLTRTPYSIIAYDDEFPETRKMAPSVEFLKAGYIFVFQDIRGTYKSEGEFIVQRSIRSDKNDPVATDESTDAYDTIEWLVKNVKAHNGKVGQWGISYSGWTTVMGMIDAHPALAASSPQASPSDMFVGDDWHHNGAFRLMYSFSWMGSNAQSRDAPTGEKAAPFDYGTPWGYEFFLKSGPTDQLASKYFGGNIPAWDDFTRHPDYDHFWKRQVALQHLGNIKHPILNVAGWFDSENFYGPMSIYQEIETKNPDNESCLVVGPWIHGGWRSTDGASLGDIDFGSKTSVHYQQEIVFPFFEYHLKDKGSWNPAKVVAFETGNNEWREFSQWPPAEVDKINIYMSADGGLSFDRPNEVGTDQADRYISDPGNPVPFSTGIETQAGHVWMIEDQRLASTRPDVLTYRSPPLASNITIAGPILANLFVATTGTDADFFVKLIDVFPGDADGPPDFDDPHEAEKAATKLRMGSFQMLLGVEVMRAKYRKNLSKPEPLVPGETTPVSFHVWDKFHTFKAGHRIMVQINSSWFPAYDRNPQKFMNIYTARDSDFQKHEHTILRSREFASHLCLPVLGK
jgi:putative CocE/NonD family hydrolase